ncbi:MAG: hypothetical protein RRA92_06820 [Gemmatimonadota bacterium]|nr:hypothetical protein [Gemmatimonadota bacterium]
MIASANSSVGTEPPCVWSLAGVLGPHPCDRGYECDGCELYHALAGRRPLDVETPRRLPALSRAGRAVEAEVGRIVSTLLGGCRIELDRWYGPGGVWLVPAENGALDLGLAGCVWRLARPVRDLELPRPGMSFQEGETCGWLLRRDRSLPIRMPVAGRVVETNPAARDRHNGPGRADGWDAWLLRVATEAPPEEVGVLLRGEDALAWFLRRLRLLKGLLRETVEQAAPGLGPVLADGGAAVEDLEEVLGSDRYGRLLQLLF